MSEIAQKENNEKVTQSALERLSYLITQIRYASFTAAVSLKEIRDNKYYKYLNYETFDDFVVEEISFMRPDQAKNYCRILDVFGKKNQIMELMGKKGSLNALIECAKELQNTEEAENFTDEKINELIRQKTEELKKKNRELKARIEGKDELLKKKNEQIDILHKSVEDSEKEARRIVDAFGKDTGLDTNKYRLLSSKNEIIGTLHEMILTMNRAHAAVTEIESTVRDAELTGIVNMLVAAMRGNAEAIESNWITELADYKIHVERMRNEEEYETPEILEVDNQLEEGLVP